jgi:hypothetical protein
VEVAGTVAASQALRHKKRTHPSANRRVGHPKKRCRKVHSPENYRSRNILGKPNVKHQSKVCGGMVGHPSLRRGSTNDGEKSERLCHPPRPAFSERSETCSEITDGH